MIPDVVFVITIIAVGYIFFGLIIALAVGEMTSADEFDVVVCGIFWPLTLAFCFLIYWPFKLLVFIYLATRAKVKKVKSKGKRKVKSKPVEVK